MHSIEFDYETVPHYEETHSLPHAGLEPHVKVETVYNAGPLNEEFQSVTYEFQSIVPELGSFREREELVVDDQPVYPVISNFGGYSSMTCLLPIEDRVKAAEFAEEVLTSLDEFMN